MVDLSNYTFVRYRHISVYDRILQDWLQRRGAPNPEHRSGVLAGPFFGKQVRLSKFVYGGPRVRSSGFGAFWGKPREWVLRD